MQKVDSSKKYKYEKIMDHISGAIHKGSIQSGAKIPSIRKTANRFQCSVSVVLQAYQELEINSIIRGVEKSGYFALPPNLNKLPEPQKYDHTLQSRASTPHSLTGKIVKIGTDRSILPLGCATPSDSILPLNRLKKHLVRLTRDKPDLLCTYSSPGGDKLLRKEISSLMLNRGVVTSPEEIIITNGCTEALALAITCTSKPGDVIGVESPTYFSLLTLLHKLGRKVLEIPISPTTGMEVDTFEARLAKNKIAACVFTANYQNPLGSVMSKNKIEKLLYLADKYDFDLIEDDVYGECSFDNKNRLAAKSLDYEGKILYCSSFSKTVSPGLRLGWLISGKYHNSCEELKLVSTLGEPLLLQRTMADFLAEGGYNLHIRKFRKNIGKQTFQIREMFSRSLGPEVRISQPKGGYFIWIELPATIDTMELFDKALNAGIGIAPGPVFCNSGNLFHNCIRVSCGYPPTEKTQKGIDRLANIVTDQLKRLKGTLKN